MKNFVDYTPRKCFASARVASPRLNRLGYAISLTRKISFSGLVIQITIVAHSNGSNNFIRSFITSLSLIVEHSGASINLLNESKTASSVSTSRCNM
jgi:hypothetical protein